MRVARLAPGGRLEPVGIPAGVPGAESTEKLIARAEAGQRWSLWSSPGVPGIGWPGTPATVTAAPWQVSGTAAALVGSRMRVKDGRRRRQKEVRDEGSAKVGQGHGGPVPGPRCPDRRGSMGSSGRVHETMWGDSDELTNVPVR